MHVSRRTGRLTAGLALSISMIMTACGSSGTTATTATTVTKPAEVPTSAQAATSATTAAVVRSAEQQAPLDAAHKEANRARKSFVGKVDGTNAYVAVVDDGVKITAYFCDSAALGLWFSAPGAAVVEASHPSGASFRATFGATGVSGEITLGGQSHAFVAQPASFPAGLWEGFVDPAVTPVTVNARYGWVVLPDGSQRGSKVVNTAVSGAGQVNTGTGTGEDGTPAAPSNPPPTRPVRNDKSTEDFCTDMFRILRGIADLYNASSDDKAKGVYLTRYTVGVGLYDRAGCQAITGVV